MKKGERSFFRRFFGSRLFLMVGFVLAILVALGYARAYYQDYKIKQEIKLLQEEVKSLEKKKLESMEILKYVTSDAFVEEKARTDLNMKKPGEHAVVVKGQDTDEVVKLQDDSEEKEFSNPQKWWEYFTKTDRHPEPEG